MNKIDLCLTNAKIYRDSNLVEGSIAIDDGKIKTISKERNLPKTDRSIDMDGSILLPGIVDPHVHFRDPGLTEKENFFTGSKAAVAGGVTTICDMPNNSPPTDTLERFIEKKGIGERKSIVDFGLHAMLTKDGTEREKMLDAGAVSLKLYSEKWSNLTESSFENKDFVLTVHPEHPEFLDDLDLSENGIGAFLKSRPREAETRAIEDILKMSNHFQPHFCHVTLSESVDLIGKNKNQMDLSSEVTPHHLLLDRSDLEEFGSIAKMHPPLRTKKDRRDLLAALQRGVIDIIATDHAPHTLEEKEKGIAEAPGGVAGIETSLPLMFTMMKEGKISLQRLVEAMCVRPAEIFGLRNDNGVLKGEIRRGADADLVAIDQDEEWEIRGENLHGKTKFTPFEGRQVVGKPFLTLIRGEIVYKRGEIVGRKGYGEFIPRRK